MEKLKINSSEFADMIMREAHVLVLPGTAFGAHGEGYIRYSYVSSETDIMEGMRRIKDYVTSVYKP